MVTKDSHSERIKNTWWAPVLVGIVGAVLVGVLSLAFLWPAKTAAPREIPIGITGSKQQLAMTTKAVEANAKGKINLVVVASRDEAITKMQHRELFGAIVLTANPEVLTASANGPTMNGVVSNIASSLELSLNKQAAQQASAGRQAPSVTLKKTDVIPAYSTTFDVAQLGLPIILGGAVGAVLVSVAVSNKWRRLAALLAYSVFTGALMFVILHTWFEVVPDDFWATMGAFALSIFAIGSVIVGMYTWLGLRGAGVATGFNLLVANPMSGMVVPALFMPWIWGTIGQLFAVGAAGTLLRGALYFPVAEVILMPIIVLIVWSTLGVAAMLSRRNGRD